MKRIFLVLVMFSVISFAGEKAWPGVDFTEVKAYHWPVKMDTKSLIDKKFKLLKGVVNPKGIVLSKEQVTMLRKSAIGKHPAHPAAACYIPHNLFVFYKDKKPVAYLEICFDCLGYRTYPESKSENLDVLTIAKICQQLKIPFGKYKNIETLQKFLKN